MVLPFPTVVDDPEDVLETEADEVGDAELDGVEIALVEDSDGVVVLEITGGC